jgi:putative photosynthetic complex assembly protein 2
MATYGYPILHALFVWWFSTGLILYLDGLPQRTFRWSMAGATAVYVGAIVGLAGNGDDTSVGGAYAAFTYGLLAWAWQEISFYTGMVTGPRRHACEPGCSGWRHFGHALQASLHHEIAIVVGAVLVVGATWGQPNQVGTWTYMILWGMHESARLNVFLGVRNLSEGFLPDHLRHLKSFLARKPMNLLFPVSVTVATVVVVLLVQAATGPGASAFDQAGYTFLATLMVVALAEHWFLMIPLPTSGLWSWGLRSRAARQAFDVEIVTGFHGAGKTTALRHLLAEVAPSVRTVALVGDLAAIGGAGGSDGPVELPNGCVCLALDHADLDRQVRDVVARWSPRRILIEPSAMADVEGLCRILGEPDTRPLVRSLTVRAVIDADAFPRDAGRMPDYFARQAALAAVLMVNKSDLVDEAALDGVIAVLRELNPAAAIVPAVHGVPRLPETPSRPAEPVPHLVLVHTQGSKPSGAQRTQ